MVIMGHKRQVFALSGVLDRQLDEFCFKNANNFFGEFFGGNPVMPH